jgi:hypothetical protein
MTDDLVKRLLDIAGDTNEENETLHEAADRIEQLNRSSEGWKEIADEYFDAIGERNTRIEKLEAALKNISEGDIPRKVKIPFRDDGQSSKHDRCEHGQWFYEDCGFCIEDYARKALEGKDD